MNIEEETIQKMKTITAALSDLELLLSSNGYKGPEKQLHIERNNKITLPFGYIRKADQFRIDYKLFKLIDDRAVINNIAYSLQMSDFYNYVLNRFNIFLSIDQYFTKYAITNIFSSFEALLFASVAKLHKFCISKDGVICSKCNKCSYYINSVNQFKFKNLLDLYIEKIGISIFNEEKSTILLIKELRDNVHIWQTKYNELSTHAYTIVNYNKMIKILLYCKSNFYDDINSFKLHRYENCKKART